MSIETYPLLGGALAGYRIESVLGRGGMGVVYLATDLRLKRRVALKLVAPELAADTRFRERFLREAELAASLDHSHVVPVYAAGETDGHLWIAMRYVQGTDLRTLLDEQGPLEPARAVELCSQIGEALDAAHAHGLVHRDVKPANVLVTEEGGEEHCYLSDFGLARSPEEPAEAGGAHLSGTIDYTAPEQSAREPLDHRADVYSLGCVLYECLAGEPPFKRPRPVATLFAHASEPPPSLHERRPELPEAIDGVIATALAKEPGNRYDTCSELVLAGGEALGLAREPRLTRRALLATAGGAVVLAAAAAVPAILLTRGDARSSAPPPILPLAGDSAVRIDPATGHLVAAVTVDAADTLAVGDGAVWILDTATRALVRIDAAGNQVTAQLQPEPQGRGTTIAAGAGAVWVVATYAPESEGASLWRLDEGTGSYVPYAGGPFSGLTIGLGNVWTTGLIQSELEQGLVGSLNQIEPSSGVTLARVEGDRWDWDEMFIATDAGLVWTASAFGDIRFPDHEVAAFDPAASAVVAEFTIDFTITDFAAGEGALWVTHPDADAIARIDPATGQVTREIRVGRIPEKLAAGAGAVWVASARDQTITRVDATSLDIATIDVGGVPTDVAVGEGAVWATVDVR
jgi:serine/threonine-protein kinase